MTRHHDKLTPSMFPPPTRGQPRRPPGPPVRPAVARSSDPETSHSAAASLPTSKLRESQLQVLSALAGGPASDAGVARRLEGRGVVISSSGARTRRSELVRAGLVRDTWRKEKMPSGRMAVIWEITAAGRALVTL